MLDRRRQSELELHKLWHAAAVALKDMKLFGSAFGMPVSDAEIELKAALENAGAWLGAHEV